MPASTTTTQPSAEPSFEYAFPAIRGVQAGREYYVSMCPLRLVPKVFLFNETELVPGLRAQAGPEPRPASRTDQLHPREPEELLLLGADGVSGRRGPLRAAVQWSGAEPHRHASCPDGDPVPHQ